MASNKKQPSQGGGNTKNTEPRVQVFTGFAGCNFELSPRSFDASSVSESDQTDLMMNQVVIQNNAKLASNKTIETRNNITEIAQAPDGKTFTGVSLLVDDKLFLACDDGSIVYTQEGVNGFKYVGIDQDFVIDRLDETQWPPVWTSFCYGDDRLIALTESNRMFDGYVNDTQIYIDPANLIPDPGTLTVGKNDDIYFEPKGDLEIAFPSEGTVDLDKYPYRVGVAISYINKYGPTCVSDQVVFYANIPVNDWNSNAYLNISGSNARFALAVEMYYVVDNASSLQFAIRTEVTNGKWAASWIGYLLDTAMWSIANLQAPTENHTLGVPASKMTMIDGRFYFWGDKDHMYRLYVGGNPGNLLSTAIGTGGGFCDVEPGSGQEIRVVTKYKTQSGNSIVTMLCSSKNSSREQRYNLVENTVTLASEQSMKSWQSEQVSGAVGCKSYEGAIVCEDGLYSVSRYGVALTTMTMEYNSQIKTNYISDPIKPVFTTYNANMLNTAIMLDVDGIIYCALGSQNEHSRIDNILFCYDVALKAWWTYTLDTDVDILNLIHYDYENEREGIGIVTADKVYLLPTTADDPSDESAQFETLIETAELSTAIPLQQWHRITQVEFRFDRFIGELEVELICYDQFGRKIITKKTIKHDTVQYDLAEYMRVDLTVESYKLRIRGKANFRLTHFMSKLYLLPKKVGIVWGFNDKQSYRTDGDIHPTFKDYNDIRKAIIV